MKKQRVILIALSVFLMNTLGAQVRLYQGSSNISNVSTFLDATSNIFLNAPNNRTLGKGIAFPRTDLTLFGSFATLGPTGIPTNYNTNLDGFLIYNTGVGTSMNGGNIAVDRGFYYYDNDINGVNVVDSGEWVRLLTDVDLQNIPASHDTDWLVAGTNNISNNIADNIYTNGNVGIGVQNPTASLDIANTLRIRGGNPVAGRVLTTDANGNATWQAVPSGADNLGNHIATQNIQLNSNWLSGDGGNEGVYVQNNGNVGVGTSTPNSRLEVNGAAVNTTVNSVLSNSIDFSISNLATTSSPNVNFSLSNLRSGGTYTLAYTGTTRTKATFSAPGFTFYSPNLGVTRGQRTVYTLVVMGSEVYVYMITNINQI